MGEFAPLRTGQLVIRQRAPWHRRAAAVLIVIAAVAVMYGLFEWGRASAGYDVVKATQANAAAAAQIKRLQSENATLRARQAAADLAGHVDRQAYGEVERSLNELQNQVLRQQEVIGFYRGILTPEQGAEGLKIQRFEVLPGPGTREFTLHVVLVQSIRQESVVTGTAVIELEGMQGGKSLRLPLAEVASGAAVRSKTPLPFSFRYFQNLEQEVVLPAGFVPSSVDIELRPARQSAVKQTFPWQVPAVAG